MSTNSGTVKFFNKQKGFGFISGDDGTDYFVHFTDVEDQKSLNQGDTVDFDLGQGKKGTKAVKVKLITGA